MNFFSKIVANSVGLIIISTVSISLLFLRVTQTAIVSDTLEHLDSLTTIEEQRITDTVEQYINGIQLVASRTQLRILLAEYAVNPTVEAQERMEKILSDAQSSNPSIVEIIIRSTDRVVIATAGEEIVQMASDEQLEQAERTYFVKEMLRNEDDLLHIRGFGPLVLDSETIGTVEVVYDAGLIAEVVSDYTGLGRTGEIQLAQLLPNGDAQLIAPMRFDADAALRRTVQFSESQSPVHVALRRQETLLDSGENIDYRGKEVFASTRYVEGLGWGLVAKVDKEEILEPVAVYRRTTYLILLIVLVFGVLTAWITTRQITSPLRLFSKALSEASKDIHSVRIPEHLFTGRDEVSQLAQNFQVLSNELSDMYSTLEHKVEERTRQLEDAQRIGRFGNFWFELDTYNMYWSDEIFHLHGLAVSPDHMAPKMDEYIQLIHPEDQEMVVEAISTAHRSSEDKENTHRIVLPDESIRWIAVRYRLVDHDDKQRIEGTYQNVTERMQIDQAKTEFVSLASHQLRTPLSSINWYSELLLEGDAGKVTAEQKDYLSEIYTANQRMVTLVNALLNVSRLELNTFVIEPQMIHIRDIVREVKKDVQPLLQKRKQKLVTRVNTDVPKILLDKDMMEIVIHNLLTNAIKYSPKESKITLRAFLDAEDVVIEVEDNGLGIPKADQDNIFTKLYRANNVRNSDTDGTGLGLYMIKQIVEHSKGTITFVSEEGEGSTFTVRIPLVGMTKKEGTKKLV